MSIIVQHEENETASPEKNVFDDIFTEEQEHQIVEWAMKLQLSGFRLSKQNLIHNAELQIKNRNNAHRFRSRSVRLPWCKRFTKRYPEIKLFRPHQIEYRPSEWYALVRKYLKSIDSTDILQAPERIFSMTELAFSLEPNAGDVVEKKGISGTKFSQAEQVVAFVGGNAAGIVAAPMLLFDRMRLHKIEAEYQVPASWALGCSHTGWMTASSLYEFIVDTFHPWLLNRRVPLPIVLFVDGFATPVTQALSEFCERGRIILVGLPSSETNAIQPMDFSMLAPLQSAWRDVLSIAPDKIITKENFCSALYDVIAKSIDIDSFKNGFKVSGIFPFKNESMEMSNGHKGKRDSNSCENTEVLQFCLSFLEDQISTNHPKFTESPDLWIGPSEDAPLFELWREMKTDLEPTVIKEEPCSDDECEITSISDGATGGASNDVVIPAETSVHPDAKDQSDMSVRNDTKNEERTEILEFCLSELEVQIAHKLPSFIRSPAIWNGSPEDESLFKLWKEFKTDLKNSRKVLNEATAPKVARTSPDYFCKVPFK